MNRKKTIKIPIYYGELVLRQVDRIDEVNKEYGIKNKDKFEAIVHRDHYKNGYTRYVIVFSGYPSHATIAHEAMHLVCFIFEDRSMNMDTRDWYQEPQSYLMGWVVKQCYKFLKLKS